MLGEQIDRYQITARLGEGGMAVVYLAQHTSLDRRAVVKMLRERFLSDEEIAKRFVNEASAMARIRHPGIVDVMDVGRHPGSGQLYILMEYLEGASLRERLDQVGSMSIAQSLSIARQAADALAAAHAKGIVHRDLKPANVFLVPDSAIPSGERVKLLDFGLAKLMDGAQSSLVTRTGVLMGTPMYMSPEQCRGAGLVDHRTDLYALGCIVFELLCGRPPFFTIGVGDLIAAHMWEAPPPVSTYRSVPREIEALLARLLAKELDERIGSATDLVTALDALPPEIAHEPGDGDGAGPRTRSAQRPVALPGVPPAEAQNRDGLPARRVAPTLPASEGRVADRRPPEHVARERNPRQTGQPPVQHTSSDRNFRQTGPTPAQTGSRERPRQTGPTPAQTGSRERPRQTGPTPAQESGGYVPSHGEDDSMASAVADVIADRQRRQAAAARMAFDDQRRRAPAHPDDRGPRPRERGRIMWLAQLTVIGVVAVAGITYLVLWMVDGLRATRAEHLQRDAQPVVVPEPPAEPPVQVLAPSTPLRPALLALVGGEFVMGSPVRDKAMQKDEEPPHPVTLSPFLLCDTEVTQAQWRAVMKSNPSDCDRGCGAALPVQDVSWYDAVSYLNALTDREDLTRCYEVADGAVTWRRDCTGYRLPTEAEWEFATRAGNGDRYSFGDDTEHLDEHGWYADNSEGVVHPVGSKQPNRWGVYDAHGNVYEWVWDEYAGYSEDAQRDPLGPAGAGPVGDGEKLVMRGGSFSSEAGNLRSAVRYWAYPTSRNSDNGLRCARNATR